MYPAPSLCATIVDFYSRRCWRSAIICVPTCCIVWALFFLAAMTDLPAGQKRCSGPSYMAKFLATGTLSSFSVRWGGWSPSWLVPLRATEESRSKLIFPSGLGYSIGVQSFAGFSWSASRPKIDPAGLVMKCWLSSSFFLDKMTWVLIISFFIVTIDARAPAHMKSRNAETNDWEQRILIHQID